MATGRQQRRDRLLKAAQRAVVMHGADVRLKDIADMAGLTSGAILYHFPDMQSLLLEANRAVMERFYDNRLKAIQGLSSPGEMLVVTIASGLPVDYDDEDVKLLCALGGAASRYPVYAEADHAVETATEGPEAATWRIVALLRGASPEAAA